MLPLLALLRQNASVLYGQGRVVLGTAPERLGRDAVVLTLVGMAVTIAAPLTPPTVMGFVAIGGGGELILLLYLRRRIAALPADAPRAFYTRWRWAASALVLGLTGGLAKQAGNVIGVGDTAVQVWNIAKWPALILFVSFMFAVLYWAAPNVKQPGFKWISPGSLLAVIGWVIASVAFAFYVANFGSYNKTYGALAGPIVFLVWVWVSNIMILLGAEFNAELERGRAIEAGMRPEDQEPFAEPRDTRKMETNPS